MYEDYKQFITDTRLNKYCLQTSVTVLTSPPLLTHTLVRTIYVDACSIVFTKIQHFTFVDIFWKQQPKELSEKFLFIYAGDGIKLNTCIPI